jgi:hypothetical protein
MKPREALAPPGSEERLRGELGDVLEVIRRAGGGVVFEEYPGAFEDVSEADPIADRSSAIRRALIEEANNLADTLERIRLGDGEAAQER